MNRIPRRGTGLRRALTAGLALGITIGVATSANAAFPGANGKIAYSKNLGTEFGGQEIFTINPDGTGETNITNNAASDNSPDWSADGTKIAFRSDRGGSTALYTMDPDGSNVTIVPNTAGELSGTIGAVSWSPDGTKLAFASIRGGIGVINVDGTGLVFIGPAGQSLGPEWSPDGSRITFYNRPDPVVVEPHDIWVMNADGTAATNLTNTPDIDDDIPDWSPDGNKIVWNEAGLTAVMNPDGTGASTLTGQIIQPAFAPDGTRIVGWNPATGALATIAANGGGLAAVGGAINTRQHDWQPVEATEPEVVPPVVSKTASPQVRREVTWEVLKSANLSKAGWDKKDSSVAVAYRVEVNRRLGVPVEPSVAGGVKIVNPNGVPITVTSVADSLPGADCTQFNSPLVIPAGGEQFVGYGCSFPTVPAGVLTNTATVSWSANSVAGTPVSATAPVDFSTATVTEFGPSSVMVTDTLDGDTTRVIAEELGVSKIFRYTRYLRASEKCVTYDNAARLLGVGVPSAQGASEVPIRPVVIDKDHASVRICPPTKDDPSPKDPPVVVIDNKDGTTPVPVPTKPVDNPKGPVVTNPKSTGKMIVVKRADTRRATVGDTVVWSITVRNTGKADLTDVVLTDRLPRHLRVIDDAKAPLAKAAKRSNRLIKVGVGDLLVGQSVTIRVATRVVGKPVLTPMVMRETARAKDRDTQRNRARRGITCNLVTATADNARDRGAISCIRITRPERDENGPVNPT